MGIRVKLLYLTSANNIKLSKKDYSWRPIKLMYTKLSSIMEKRYWYLSQVMEIVDKEN